MRIVIDGHVIAVDSIVSVILQDNWEFGKMIEIRLLGPHVLEIKRRVPSPNIPFPKGHGVPYENLSPEEVKEVNRYWDEHSKATDNLRKKNCEDIQAVYYRLMAIWSPGMILNDISNKHLAEKS